MTVGLWQASLDLAAGRLAELASTLDTAERARADALRGDRLRARYVADHGWRRRLLAKRLGCAPAEVVYEIDGHGKPRVAGATIHFSAARSDDRALYAISEQAPVGVDIERLRDDIDLEAMARRFFSAAEREAWSATAAQQRLAAGFACWSRKEAWAKAEGSGLVFPLSDLDVWAGDERPIRCRGLVVTTVDAGGGFAAAVAVRADTVGAVTASGRPRIMT